MNSKTVISNFIWRFLERCGAKLISFVLTMVLARLLAPEVYGTIALVTVFTTVLSVFVDSGLGNALIQKKDADDVDFSTVFYFNVIICSILYLGMFLAAPRISNFYGDFSLTSVIRVLSLTLVVSGVKNVQQAYVSRTMQFKRFFFATLGGTLGAAIVGIYMAYSGFGIWALVVQQLLNETVDTIILWITVKWRPKKQFSVIRLKILFSYGWKLLASSLLDTIYNNIRQLIIGKMYSTEDLSFYNRGKQFPDFIVSNINTSIDSVLLPTLSKEQDDSYRVKSMTRRAIVTSTYIMAPLMIGLACCAESMVKLILTEKWMGCVPYLRVFCITFIFYPIHTANLNAIKAVGRSDLFLKLEIAKKIVGFIILFSTMWYGTMVMTYSLLLSSVLGQLINTWPNRKLLNYGYIEQLKDIMPSVILAFTMGILVYMLKFLPLATALVMVTQIIVGIVYYFLISKIFHFEPYIYILNTIKSFKNKMK